MCFASGSGCARISGSHLPRPPLHLAPGLPPHIRLGDGSYVLTYQFAVSARNPSQVECRCGTQARLQSSEAQIQQLHVSLTAVEQEKAHLRAQVQTLSQLLSRGTDQRSDQTSGNAVADWRVSDLQQQLHVSCPPL